MKVKIEIVLSTEWCDENLGAPKRNDPLEARIIDSVEEAVRNAIDRGTNDGFTHDMEDLIAISVESIKTSRIAD